jgi:hypothetical protein
MATLASGSRLQLGYVPEVTPGTTPATPTLKLLRVKSHTLGLERGQMQSAELRGDRQIADFRLGMRSVKGDIDCEFSATTFDDMIEAAMGGTWTTNVLKAGTLLRSFSIEAGHLDISQYRLFKGCMVDKLSLGIKPNSIMDMKMSILGMDEAVSSTTAASATTAAGTSSPVDGNNPLCIIQEGGTALAIITGVDLTLENSSKALDAIGSNKAAGITMGRSKLTGTVTAYVPDMTLYSKYVNETNSTLSVAVSDGTHSYTFLIPKLKYTGAKIDVSNEDALVQTLPFIGLYDPTTGTNLQITRT